MSTPALQPGVSPACGLSLSILVPTWNRLNHLKNLLPGLLPLVANEPRVELVVSNNGSTDGTRAFLEGLPRQPRCRIVHQPTNYGPHIHIAWLYGQAQASYLWLFADDDTFEPALLGEILACLEARPELGWIHLPHQFVRPGGLPRLSRCPESLHYEAQSRRLFPQYMRWITFISSNVIRCSLLHPLLPGVTLENPFWPVILLMDAVGEHPGCVLPVRWVTGGWAVTWADQAKQIGWVEFPETVLASRHLNRAEKRAALREHYRLDPDTLDGLARFAPGLLFRLLWLDPLLCSPAFVWRVLCKAALRITGRPPAPDAQTKSESATSAEAGGSKR